MASTILPFSITSVSMPFSFAQFALKPHGPPPIIILSIVCMFNGLL